MGALASPRNLQGGASSPSNAASAVAKIGQFLITPARTGDLLAVQQLLQSVFGGPSPAEFQAQQEEPGHLPAHRFVVREGHRVVAHARVSLRQMQLDQALLPVARVFDLCVLPEFRQRGLATHLLLACEQLARQHGAVLMQARSPRASLLERIGWFACGRHQYSLAGPREVLAEMERRRYEQSLLHQASDDLPQLSRARHPLTVRRWKQTEHAAVQRLYGEATAGLSGPLVRSDAYWRWLISRSAYDWFYVAINGPDRTLFDDIQGNIVGYMFIKSNRIVEVMAAPADQRAPAALLARACRDAMEQSITPLRLDAPAGHHLQELIAAAGGKAIARESDGGETMLAKALDLPRLAAATLQPSGGPARLALQIRDEAATIPLYREPAAPMLPERWVLDGGQLAPDQSPPRPQIQCSTAAWCQLLLGHTVLAEAVESKQIRLAGRKEREALEQRLAPRALWFPPLDDLLA